MTNQPNEVVRCFKCEQPVRSAAVDVSAWDCPDGVQFDGGWNFGSSHYDAMMDGVYVEIVVCDDCIKKAQSEPDRMREMRKKVTHTKERVTKEAGGG